MPQINGLKLPESRLAENMEQLITTTQKDKNGSNIFLRFGAATTSVSCGVRNPRYDKCVKNANQ